MKQARPTEADFDSLIDFFNILEAAIENGEDPDNEPETAEEWECAGMITDARIVELIRKHWGEHRPGVGTNWRRVIFGGQLAVTEACDQTLPYLEWRPELKEAADKMDAAQKAKATTTP